MKKRDKRTFERERIEFEREKNAPDRELELQVKQLEFETQKKNHELELEARATSKTEFNVSKSIRLVPKFQEKDFDKYFIHFEKKAENLK